MVVDHLGAIFFTDTEWLRIVGRLCFPLYAYYIAEGVKRTKNYDAYIKRLLLFAVISQPLHTLAFKHFCPNVFFTLAFGAFAAKQISEKKYLLPSIIIIMTLVFPTSVEYGIFGIGTILAFYFTTSITLQLRILILCCMLYIAAGAPIFQCYAILAVALIYAWSEAPGLQLNKHFLYLFYPAHLCLLFLVTLLNQ